MTNTTQTRLVWAGMTFVIAAAALVSLFHTPRMNRDYVQLVKEKSELHSAGKPSEHINLEGIARFEPLWSDPIFWPAVSLAGIGVALLFRGVKKRQTGAQADG